MPKEEQIVTEGTVTQVLPGTMFRVDLPRTGAWWARDDGTEYLRPVTLRDFH